MEMLGEVKGYCRKNASEFTHGYLCCHILVSVGGYTCWSRVKVRVSRTNWETESSAVDGCRTRLTSQPLQDSSFYKLPAGKYVKIKAAASSAAYVFKLLVFKNCTHLCNILQPKLIKQSNAG